jgi:3-oxoacyl-[acyl-carrier-protein] synthase II
MALRPQVVITGIGVVSPNGVGHESFWHSLCEQRSGVSQIPAYAETGLPVRIGAELNDFEPKLYVKPRKAMKVMSREIQIGFSAAALAMSHSDLDVAKIDPDRLGVLFGSEMMYCHPEEMVDVYRHCMADRQFDFSKWGDAAMSQMYPLWMLKYLPNMTACHIGISQDARGPNNTICEGEASSLLAMIEALWIIQRGHADVMIAGGSGSRLSLTPMMYRTSSNVSHRNDDPPAASRPFDAERDGMVNGEGGAAFVLESEAHARARGATILAKIAGWGSSIGPPADGTALNREAICRSIHSALEIAGKTPEQVGHVNAHATGTTNGDPVEAQAIRQCLGDVPVTAPKSYFGNLGAGGGAVEMAASLLALMHGQVPTTLNYQNPDPACPVAVVRDTPLAVSQPSALVLNQSGTGQAAAIMLEEI